MITKNPMQLKAFIKKKAEENKISAQLVMQNYMMERLLERISLSKYKQNFILKGGFLIAAIVGLDTRATMDLDATVKGLPLTHESIGKIFDEICAMSVEDDVSFSVSRITDIREGDIYPGLRVALTANYSPLAVPLTVDVTTGDKITPREIEYSFRLMFDDRSISVLAYNLETILAEKIETVLSRNIANTRPRDFYDIHILYALRWPDCDLLALRQALEETVNKRGSKNVLDQYTNIIRNIQKNPQMRGFWERYQKDFDYAKDITFDDACNSVLLVMNKIAAALNFKGGIKIADVFVKNKLIQDGKTIGYTVTANGIESVYSVRDAVHLVHAAENSNVFIVRDKESRLRMNDNDIRSKLNNSHLRAKTGKLPSTKIKNDAEVKVNERQI